MDRIPNSIEETRPRCPGWREFKEEFWRRLVRSAVDEAERRRSEAVQKSKQIEAAKTGDGRPVTKKLLNTVRTGAQHSDRCKLKYVYILEKQALVDPG